MTPRTFALFGFVSAALVAALPVCAAEEKVEPTRAILVDASNGNVLHAVAPDATFPPGNLAKLMTLAVIGDAVGASRISGQTPYLVSERAWRTGGAPSRNTTMFAKLKSYVSVNDLMRGMAVVQANDAAIVLAEGFAGSEDNFVLQMNAYADRIGLKDTRYVNATGLPAPNQTTTARDTVRLLRHLIEKQPDIYKLLSAESIDWSDIFQRNKNPYLSDPKGTDGGFVGAAQDFGHFSALSTVRDGRRLIAMVGGLPNADSRDTVTRQLLELGFNGFIERQIFAGDAPITTVRVFGGEATHVALYAPDAIKIAVPRAVEGKVVARVVYDGPLTAPLRQGETVATLRVWRDGQLQREVPLHTREDIPVGGLVRRATDSVRELAISAFRSLVPGGGA
jgi:D-alanyl-D-alanine carboxypeptidase (penicillin-binding protein 5/6)